MIQVSKTKLDRVWLITPSIFKDLRGQYVEIYNEKLYREKGIDIKFVQDDIAISFKNVIRGIHGDSETWKLVSCLYGKIYVAVVNCDTDSKDFGRWQSFVLSDENRQQVLIPANHGNSYLTLSEMSVFHYKQSTYYGSIKQFTYKWNDPRFKIQWPIKNPILSKRDETGE